MKRITLAVILTIVMVGAGVLGYRQIASAFGCGSVCGYFTNRFGSAWFNVLPAPGLTGDNSFAQFNVTISADLYSGTFQKSVGAAFIIDDMLGYRGAVQNPAGGGTAAGIAYAKANYGTLFALLTAYTSGLPGYGINWNYTPAKAAFCDAGNNIDSGYDDGVTTGTGVVDDMLYHVPAFGTAGCNQEFANSMPEMEVYWPGGTFEIGKQCGNVQDHADRIPTPPPPNRLPTGTISVSCNPATGQQTASVTLSDPDAATNGYITTGAWTSGTVNSPGPANIAIPLPPTTNPYVAQGVSLHVKDTGPFGSGAYNVVANTTTQVPCVSFGCGSLTYTPTVIDPYMQFSLSMSVTNNINQPPPGATITVTVTPPAGAAYNFNGSQAAGGGGSISTATFNNLGPTGKAGVYSVHWTLTGSGVNVPCNGSFPVVYLPYANVYGGDVMVGASPTYNGSSSSCSVANDNGGVFSWNNHNTAGFPGAGAQYAVQALASITDFASALGSTNIPPHNLSFSNDAALVNDSQGLFGGGFGAITGDCDFTSDLTSSPITGAAATAQITSLPALLADNTQTVIYATGNVYISRDIKYDTAGWTSVSQIPSFKLVVVGGNIYIGSGVTQLDGIYVAESTNGSDGVIYTCAKANGSEWNPKTDIAAGYYAACNQTLTVNGAFVAAQVQLERTPGSVGQAKATDNLSTNHDAEIFNYTPEIWLPRNATTPNGGYDTITGLPPVL